MEVRLAETFLKVSELGNITRSAEELGYSQGTVTAQIKQLETELGVQLFDRIGRGIQLSDAGRAFIPLAAELVRASQAAEAFGISETEPSGHITIMAGSSVTYGMLPYLVMGFKKKYPLINLNIITMDSRNTMIEGLRQNRHEFVLDIGARREYQGCVKPVERIEPFVFVCSATDPIAGKKKVSLHDIFDDRENHPFIFHGGDKQVFSIWTLLQERNINPKSFLEFSSPIAIVELLLQGYGRSLLPRFVVERELARGTLAVIDTDEKMNAVWSQMFYNADKWITPAMRAFIDYTSMYLRPE